MTRSTPQHLTTTDLVEAARNGDERAWRDLIDRMKNVIWKTVNGFDLGVGDTEDAFSATVFRLAEHLDDIRDPERLPGWLATTARNECLSLLRTRRRVVATEDVPTIVVDETHDTGLLRDELHQAVHAGFRALSARCQRLLRLLTADPPVAYRDVATILDMPIGSIGATRRRCLDSLRATDAVANYLDSTT